MTNDDERGEGGKKCRKFDDVICERPLKDNIFDEDCPVIRNLNKMV